MKWNLKMMIVCTMLARASNVYESSGGGRLQRKALHVVLGRKAIVGRPSKIDRFSARMLG